MVEVDDNIFGAVTDHHEETSFLLLYAISNQGGDPGIDCFPWHGSDGIDARALVLAGEEDARPNLLARIPVKFNSLVDNGTNWAPGIHTDFGDLVSKKEMTQNGARLFVCSGCDAGH